MAKAQHMGFPALAVGVLCTAAIPICATGAETVAKPQPLKCDIGPVTKTYGATQWQVYSCADQRSVVILSTPGSPAAPFYFMFSPGKDGYRLYGEGTGSKDATAAAYDELKVLSTADIAALIEQTKPR